VWAVQLVLNAAWSWLFFGLHRPDLALVDIVLLLVAIAAFCLVALEVEALAAGLFIPYLLWAGFATALNLAIRRLNLREAA
jgi:tryptophan-rich sensory protein